MAENQDRGGPACGNSLHLEKKGWRWCFVPGCKNTSVSAPNMIFLQVPKNLKTRRLWARLARREDASTLNSRNVWFCCEDHFNVSWWVFGSTEYLWKFPNDEDGWRRYWFAIDQCDLGCLSVHSLGFKGSSSTWSFCACFIWVFLRNSMPFFPCHMFLFRCFQPE